MSAATMSDEGLRHSITTYVIALLDWYWSRGQEVPEPRWETAIDELRLRLEADGVEPHRVRAALFAIAENPDALRL